MEYIHMSYDKSKPLTILIGDNSFIKIILSATAGAFVGMATFVEDTVQLANNEVANLEQAQQIRLDEVKDERATLKAQRTAKAEELAANQD